MIIKNVGRKKKRIHAEIALSFNSLYHNTLMNAERLVIGLDGGGTKTAAELSDGNGNALASATGGPTNFQVMGVEPAARTIVDLIETCCHTVGCSVNGLDSAVAGLTGAGRPGDQARMREGIRAEIARRKMALRRVRVESDARIALEGATGGKPGVIVIAGTGSIVFGKDTAGTVHRAGGWGRIIGDEGSGYALGREVFRAVAAAWDGRSPRTSLPRLLKKSTGLETPDSIITALYRENFDVASVAPIVTAAAAKGDRVARRILEQASNEIVDVMTAVIRKVRGRSKRPVSVSFIGSVLTSTNPYSRRVRSLIRTSLPGVTIRPPEAPPVHGAVLLALAELPTTD
jgi:N-acetylglucosamine kinase-like BadF-type ATPase